MKNKGVIQAKGYRVPKIIIRDLVKSVLTLGIKGSKIEPEVAKTFAYKLEGLKLTIYEEKKKGELEEVGSVQLESDEKRQKVLSKVKFTYEGFVYYLDKESIEEK